MSKLPFCALSPSRFAVRLILAVAALTLGIVLLVGVWLWQSYQQFELQAKITSENLSQLLERSVAANLDKVDTVLLTVLDEIRRQKGERGSIDDNSLNTFMNRQILRLPGVESLRRINSQGMVQQRANAAVPQPLSLSDQEVLAYLREDPAPGLVTALSVKSNLTNRWGIMLARQINTADGRFDGTVVAIITLNHFVSMFSSLELGDRGAVSLRDEKLTILARYPEVLRDSGQAAGKAAPSQTLRSMIGTSPSRGTYVAEAGVDKVVRALSYHKISGYPLYVIVGLARENYMVEWQQQAQKAVALASVFLLLCLGLAYAVWRSWNQRESALRQSHVANQRLQAVLHNIPVGLAIVNDQRHIQMVNGRLSDIFQVDCDRLIHHSTAGLYGSLEQFEDLGRQSAEQFQHSDIFNTELLLLRPNGSSFWARMCGRRIDGDGSAPEIIWICEDISDRKAQEHTLRDQEARMRLMVEAATDWIWEADHLGTYTYSSPRVRDVLGMEPDAVLGCSIFGFMDLDQARHLEHIFADARAGIIPNDFVHIIHRTRHGQEVVMESAISPVIDERGIFRGFRGIDRDITIRSRIEQALQEKSQELARSNADLEQFAYVASHDLREPLRMVSSYVALLERRYGGQLDAEALDYIHFAKDGAQRLDRLILDLLEYSRVGRMGQAAELLSLEQVVQDATMNLQATLAESRGTVSIDGDLPSIWGNSHEMVRLFQNLIANAVKYHDPDRPPSVRISARPQDNQWVVDVQDNGIGMAVQDTERVFGIFQRLHPRDKYEGTGIGLAVCKKIVEHHHGRIWVDSIPGTGSTFHISIPKA